MFWRICSFVLCQAAGGLLGWWLADDVGALAGTVAGSLAWFVIDLLRGLRLLQWLRRGTAAGTPPASGLWGEAAERIRRSLRTRDQLVTDADQRLQDFLAAIQASPNGVVLLDATGRIE